MRRPRRYMQDIPPGLQFDPSGPAFTHERMDEGPVLNRIGRVAVFLSLLGIRSARDILDGTAPKPRWRKYTRLQR